MAACRREPGSGFRGWAYVAARGSRMVSVVDLETFAVQRQIPLNAPPAFLTRAAGSRYVHAALAGTSALAEIDGARQQLQRTISLAGEAQSVLPEPGGKSLLVLLREPATLVRVPIGAGKPERVLSLEGPVEGFDLDPAGKIACAALRSGEVQFVDLGARKALPAVRLKAGLGAVKFRSDSRVVLVAERQRRQLTVLDAATRQIVVELPLALEPDTLCMKEDGGQLFVTGAGRDAVVIVYPYRTEVAQTNLTGRKPSFMAVSAVPAYLFVSNPEAGTVTVFDVETQKVVAVVGVGQNPGYLAVTPDQQYALVLNRGTGDMAVIRIPAIRPGREKRAALFTMTPVGADPVHMLVIPRA
jgi:YVTN family beta-propeller protein